MSKFAVIKTGGKQYRVAEGDVLIIEKLPAEGAVVFDEVLLAVDGDKATIGAPLLSGAKVTASRVEDGRGKKVTIVKFKSKARYRKKAGHRQPFTKVKIDKIS